MKNDASRPGSLSLARDVSRHAGRRATRQRPTRGNALGVVGSAGSADFFSAHRAFATPPGRTRWRVRPGPLLTPDQKDWVSRGGSLTAHLARLGPVSVRVMRESVDAAWPDERAGLRPPHRRAGVRVWTREVLLSVGTVPCVAAHSATPVAHSHGVWQAMRVLRTRPLADLLYHDRAVRRSPLVSRRLAARRSFSSTDPLAGLAYAAGIETGAGAGAGAGIGAGANDPAGIVSTAGESHRPFPRRYPVVARRSLFERHGAPLMITECFLPALWHLLENRRASRRKR